MGSKAVGFLTFNFGANMGGFNKAMKKAQRKVKNFGKSMKRVGSSMTTGLTLPIIGLGAIALKTFADFEQSMLKVKAVSGATASEFKSLEENAKRLGSSTMFTASQVSGLQLELSKLGLTPEEINKSTDSILSLAQATGHDLAESATIVASTMNSFGMEASQSAKIADMFAVASSSAAIDMTKLSIAMPTVGATANAVGIPLQGLTSMMMTLADSGMEASTMGTHLRKIFVELATKGISFNDAMAKINNSTDKVTTATELFGKRAFSAGLILASNTQKTADYNIELGNAAGKSKEMADIMDSGAAGAMRRMRSQLEGIAIEMGEHLIPAFEAVISKINKVVKWFGNLSDEQKKNIVKWGLIVAAIGPALMIIGQLISVFGTLIPLVGKLGGAIKILTRVMLANPYLALAAGLIAVGFAIYDDLKWIKRFNKDIQTTNDKLGDTIKKTKELSGGKFTGIGAAYAAMNKSYTPTPTPSTPTPTPSTPTNGGGRDTGFLTPYVMTKIPRHGEIIADDLQLATIAMTDLENSTESWSDMTTAAFTDAISFTEDYAMMLSDTAMKGADSFAEFGEKMRTVVKDIIGMMIAEGVAGAVSTALAKSGIPFPLNIAAAGLAGGLARTAFNTLIPSFADGGIVSGPTVGLMGEYSGAGSGNPEVIAPLNKLKGMMGGGEKQQVEVVGRISGNDIWLSNSKTNGQRNRGL